MLTLFERSSVHGERLCHDLSIPVYNVPLYYAVYGEDTAGNRGQVSNIVKVQVTWSTQKTGLELDNMDNQLVRSSNSEDTGPDWLLISIMSACLGGLFVICISVITFLYVSARRNRPSSPTPSSSTHVKVSILVLVWSHAPSLFNFHFTIARQQQAIEPASVRKPSLNRLCLVVLCCVIIHYIHIAASPRQGRIYLVRSSIAIDNHFTI